MIVGELISVPSFGFIGIKIEKDKVTFEYEEDNSEGTGVVNNVIVILLSNVLFYSLSFDSLSKEKTLKFIYPSIEYRIALPKDISLEGLI